MVLCEILNTGQLRNKSGTTVFGDEWIVSYLPPVVCMSHVLFTLFVFVGV